MLDKSIEMMRKSFEKTVYTCTQLPPKGTRNRYGVYLHVPFCRSICSFCPFYKVLFDEELKDRYVAAVRKEIEETDITGPPEWIYFGGGTPNVLSLEELESIVGVLRSKIDIHNMGIEILPAIADAGYIEGLKKLGFSKVSFGLESLSPRVNEKSSRALPGIRSVEELIRLTGSLGLWSNVDMMIGLKGQSATSFLEDIRVLTSLGPDQITTYPYMSLRGLKDVSSMPDDEKFETI
jgi:oxygen-independent coproporphyrinogen-3 oxidase